MLDWSRAARRRGTIVLIMGLLTALVLASIGTSAGASAAQSQGIATPDFQNESAGALDLDNRGAAVAPSAAQRQMVAASGANATWTAFGTPASLSRPTGFLATGLEGSPAGAARAWLLANRGLFNLSAQDVAGMELLLDVKVGAGRVVSFRQRFDGLSAANDGLVSMGIVGGKLAYLSSSLAGNQGALPSATLTPQAAFRSAAANVGHAVGAGERPGDRHAGPLDHARGQGLPGPAAHPPARAADPARRPAGPGDPGAGRAQVRQPACRP
jgi:hypothetical protein